ncbi:DUF1566 domain-containing protein [Pantoea sp. 18069]|uniref:Lcl domain-containing protein n=1 Tax=Pantoea sp. 18069 TaxID=2681415 RepID=UPI001357F95D|nr:DUF1566 domain-containing protein [Pantoea sp. 18069]
MSTQTATRTPAINQPWPEQGGIYIGSRLIDGVVHHVVIPGGTEFDTKDVEFGDVEKTVAAAGAINGHSDWRAPDQEDLMLAYINAREHFVNKGMDSYYWSRTERSWPWAVGFEVGYTTTGSRRHEFRVRPFRSFPDSSL